MQRVMAVKETKSGVLLPEQSQKKMNEGTVVEVGPGVFGTAHLPTPCDCIYTEVEFVPPFTLRTIVAVGVNLCF